MKDISTSKVILIIWVLQIVSEGPIHQTSCHRASNNPRFQSPEEFQRSAGASLQPRPTRSLHTGDLPPVSTMASTSQQQKGRDRVLPTLDVFVQVLNIAKDTCGIPPAQVAFGSASVLLAMIRARFITTMSRRTSDLHPSRIQWQTIRISSTLAGLAVTCAKYSTGD